MRFLAAIIAISLSCLTPLPARASELFEVQWKKVVKGVWVGNRPDALRYPVVANTTIVIGARSVLVFDGGGYRAQGEQTLAKIRALTKKPVSHVVVSHWHGDHHRGIAPIIEAFPGAEIIAQRFACAAMLDGPEKRVEDGEATLDETYSEIGGAYRSRMWFDGSALSDEEAAYFRRMADDFPEYKAQLAKMKVFTPTIAVDESYKIDLGKRDVALLHLGKGATAGDLVLWLPREGLIATGDIMVAPVPFGFGSYPKQWAAVLRKIIALRPNILVPGHGPVMNDLDYARNLETLLDDIARQAASRAADGAGETGPGGFDFAGFADRFRGEDPVQARLFDMYFAEPIALAAMNEASGREDKNEPLDGSPGELCALSESSE